MNKRIFRSILLAGGRGAAGQFGLIILDCLYGYFDDLQEGQLRDELQSGGCRRGGRRRKLPVPA